MFKVPLGGSVWVGTEWTEHEYIMQHFCNLLTYRTLSFPPIPTPPSPQHIYYTHTCSCLRKCSKHEQKLRNSSNSASKISSTFPSCFVYTLTGSNLLLYYFEANPRHDILLVYCSKYLLRIVLFKRQPYHYLS